ncbi:MAG: hypothetical protein ACREXI_02645 [Caldimonas sp.]
MQKIIEAENSDLFDVLAYVGFVTEPMSRGRNALGKPGRQLPNC